MSDTFEKIHNAKPKNAREIIDECRTNLFKFAQTVNPSYCYGDIHEEVFSWLSSPQGANRQLLLLPRGHLKSHCVAVYTVWKITYEPWTTLVYLVSQEDLGKAQLYAVKSMMLSDSYTALWPEMFTEKIERSKRERGVWSAYAFDVDHPCRRERSVRDHTMIMKTVKSNAQGLHCDGLVFDDVVVPQFADTAIGRKELSRSLGYFSSILNPGGWIKAVGTRYHPEDAYQSMIEAKIGIWDSEAQEFTTQIPLWDVMERVVEDSYDRSGTGNFLWPRTESPIDGKAYGFNLLELSKIKADYISHQGLVHFYSQYYNDPNDVGTARLQRSKFQYYEKKYLEKEFPNVRIKGTKLNVYAAMDVAWSTDAKSDYTAIAVIGIDHDGYIYVLDLERFRTTNFQEYYEKVHYLQHEWGFRRILVETNAAGSLVAQELEAFVRRNGGSLVVERRSASHRSGSKEEKWAAILEPRYDSKSVFHFRGGLTPELEEELLSARPRNDDLKDALCAAISIAKPPSARRTNYKELNKESNVVVGKFGGRSRVR